MDQTREEMIAVLKKAGIEDAEHLVANWTYRGRAKNVSQIMRLWINKANDTMQKFIVPYKFAAVGIDVYDVRTLMDYVYKLSCIGVYPSPLEEAQS